MKRTYKTLAVISLTLSLSTMPITVYASQWIQDTAGWKIQQDNGIYLTNQWYQSPTSGLWYYIGADGYMLTNTTTPDGYQVGSDGAWIQAPQQTEPQATEVYQEPAPTQPATQPQNNGGGIDTSGWNIGDGATIEQRPLDENQNLSPGELADIESVDFN